MTTNGAGGTELPNAAVGTNDHPPTAPFLSYQTRKFLGGSISSISSVSSTSSEFPDEEVETEDRLFIAVDELNRDGLRELFDGASNRSLEMLLQIMLTRTWNDHGGRRYFFDAEAVKDADVLLGCSTSNLNVLQICVLQGDEEMALDILDYFYRATEKLGGRKALVHEFLAHQFGFGNTVLHLAAFMGMSELCRRLLELGASPNSRNSRNFRPLDCANEEDARQQFLDFKHGSLAVPPLPLSDGPTVEGLSVSSSKDINGPVTAAKEGPMPPPVAAPNVLGSPSLAKKAPLVEHESRPPAPSSPLIQDNGAQKAASVVVDKASSLPGTPKKRRRSGTTVRFAPEILLLEICQNGDPRSKKDLETLRSLLFDASGKNVLLDVNKLHTPAKGLSPLQCVCSTNQLAIARLLITEAGAKVNVRDFEGWTPLHSAAAEGYEDIVKLLCSVQRKPGETLAPGELCAPDAPIDLRPKNLDGETPEDLAAEISPVDGEEKKDHGRIVREIISEYLAKYGHNPAPEILAYDDSSYPDESSSDAGLSADELEEDVSPLDLLVSKARDRLPAMGSPVTSTFVARAQYDDDEEDEEQPIPGPQYVECAVEEELLSGAMRTKSQQELEDSQGAAEAEIHVEQETPKTTVTEVETKKEAEPLPEELPDIAEGSVEDVAVPSHLVIPSTRSSESEIFQTPTETPVDDLLTRELLVPEELSPNMGENAAKEMIAKEKIEALSALGISATVVDQPVTVDNLQVLSPAKLSMDTDGQAFEDALQTPVVETPFQAAPIPVPAVTLNPISKVTTADSLRSSFTPPSPRRTSGSYVGSALKNIPSRPVASKPANLPSKISTASQPSDGSRKHVSSAASSPLVSGAKSPAKVSSASLASSLRPASAGTSTKIPSTGLASARQSSNNLASKAHEELPTRSMSTKSASTTLTHQNPTSSKPPAAGTVGLSGRSAASSSFSATTSITKRQQPPPHLLKPTASSASKEREKTPTSSIQPPSTSSYSRQPSTGITVVTKNSGNHSQPSSAPHSPRKEVGTAGAALPKPLSRANSMASSSGSLPSSNQGYLKSTQASSARNVSAVKPASLQTKSVGANPGSGTASPRPVKGMKTGSSRSSLSSGGSTPNPAAEEAYKVEVKHLVKQWEQGGRASGGTSSTGSSVRGQESPRIGGVKPISTSKPSTPQSAGSKATWK